MQQALDTPVISKPVPGQKAQKQEPLPVYACTVNVQEISVHQVPKYGVTAAELALLFAIHGQGADGVHSIEPCEPPKARVKTGLIPEKTDDNGRKIGGGMGSKKQPVLYYPKDELPRLRAKYGPALVKHVFGAGLSAAIPKTLEEVTEMVIEPFQKKDEEAA